jgi:hypothetical protein
LEFRIGSNVKLEWQGFCANDSKGTNQAEQTGRASDRWGALFRTAGMSAYLFELGAQPLPSFPPQVPDVGETEGMGISRVF